MICDWCQEERPKVKKLSLTLKWGSEKDSRSANVCFECCKEAEIDDHEVRVSTLGDWFDPLEVKATEDGHGSHWRDESSGSNAPALRHYNRSDGW